MIQWCNWMVSPHTAHIPVVINVELNASSTLATLATSIGSVMVPNVVCEIWFLYAGFLAVNSNSTVGVMKLFAFTAGISVADGEDVKPWLEICNARKSKFVVRCCSMFVMVIIFELVKDSSTTCRIIVDVLFVFKMRASMGLTTSLILENLLLSSWVKLKRHWFLNFASSWKMPPWKHPS